MKSANFLRYGPLCLLLCGSGCATNALWTRTSLDTFNQPADHPDLQLYYGEQQKDLLVVYTEYSERKDAVRTRAYWLYQNQERIARRSRPAFLSARRSHGLRPVAVWAATNTPVAIPPETMYAIASATDQRFALFSGERQIGSYLLPTYNDGKGTAERVALTPLAATADLTLVGGYLGVLYLYGLGQDGYSFSTGK